MCAAAFWLKLAKLEPLSRENNFPSLRNGTTLQLSEMLYAGLEPKAYVP
jgi:hypothetical protein